MSLSTDNIRPFQLRAGRALLGWSAGDLANVAEVKIEAVRRAEACQRDQIVGVSEQAILAMLDALHKHGVVLTKDMSRFGVALETRSEATA